MAESIELVLPYPISANRYWATRVIRRKGTSQHMAMTYVTPEAVAFKRDVGWLCAKAGLRNPLSARIRIDYTLYPKRPLDWAKRARKDPETWADTVMSLDLDNCAKVLLDALKGHAFDDDKRVWEIHARRAEPDGEGRVVVVITPLQVVSLQPELFGATA